MIMQELTSARRLIRAVALAGIVGVAPALGQDAAPLPLVEDIPPSAGYGDNPPDILGVRFGESRAEALAKIQTAIPGVELEDQIIELRLRDGRGNAVSFDYAYSAQGGVSGDSDEYITLRFTSDATGGRVWGMDRVIVYREGQYASMQALRDSLVSKYGEATLVERFPHQNHDQITYLWAKDANPARMKVCLYLPGSSPYLNGSGQVYNYLDPGRRTGNPGWDVCIGAMKITIFYGSNENSVRKVEITAIDYDRAMIDARHIDTLLSDLLTAKANAVTGTGAPKL